MLLSSGFANDNLATCSHKIIVTYGAGEDIVFMATDTELAGNVDWVMLQSCFDAHFLLVLEKQQDSSHDGVYMFFAVVQLIGTRKQTHGFVYRCVSSCHQSCRELMLIIRASVVVQLSDSPITGLSFFIAIIWPLCLQPIIIV